MNKKEQEEAYEKLRSHGTLRISYNDGIECEEELRTIGLDIDFIKSRLRQIDYLSCSIKYDGEHHLSSDLEEEYRKLRAHLDEFGADYEID